MHIYIFYILIVARSFELDKIAIDLGRAFIVEFVVAKILRRVEKEAKEAGA